MPTTTPPPFQSAAFLLSGAKPPEGEFLEGELGEGEFLLSHGSVMKVVLVYILYIYIERESLLIFGFENTTTSTNTTYSYIDLRIHDASWNDVDCFPRVSPLHRLSRIVCFFVLNNFSAKFQGSFIIPIVGKSNQTIRNYKCVVLLSDFP